MVFLTRCLCQFWLGWANEVAFASFLCSASFLRVHSNICLLIFAHFLHVWHFSLSSVCPCSGWAMVGSDSLVRFIIVFTFVVCKFSEITRTCHAELYQVGVTSQGMHQFSNQ